MALAFLHQQPASLETHPYAVAATLYDAWDQPCHVGGVVQNLTLGMECDDGIDGCEYVAQMMTSETEASWRL